MGTTARDIQRRTGASSGFWKTELEIQPADAASSALTMTDAAKVRVPDR
jgi:hypothetical protein